MSGDEGQTKDGEEGYLPLHSPIPRFTPPPPLRAGNTWEGKKRRGEEEG